MRRITSIIEMMKRKKYDDSTDYTEYNENGTIHQKKHKEQYQQQQNDTNNNGSDDEECDNVSLEILWQPKCESEITADVVFIHGLQGKLTIC